jgi:hypothetical protein
MCEINRKIQICKPKPDIDICFWIFGVKHWKIDKFWLLRFLKDLYRDTQVTKYFVWYVKMFVMNQGIRICSQISGISSGAWDMGQNVGIGEIRCFLLLLNYTYMIKKNFMTQRLFYIKMFVIERQTRWRFQNTEPPHSFLSYRQKTTKKFKFWVFLNSL